MTRNLIVTIIAVILIALAGGYYFMNRFSETPVNPTDTTPAVSVSQSPTISEKTSLKNFMSMGGTQKCEFSDADNGNSGSVYLNAGKMRGDFMSRVNDKETSTHMINDGTSVYIWIDDQKTGFKTTLESIEQMSNSEGVTGVSKTVDINKQVDYKCGGWNADQVKFAIPTEVKFQDMGVLLKNAQNMKGSASPDASVSTGGNTEACAACNSLEGEAQTQCKRALRCN